MTVNNSKKPDSDVEKKTTFKVTVIGLFSASWTRITKKKPDADK